MSETTRLGLALMAENASGKYLIFNALAALLDTILAKRLAVAFSGVDITLTTDQYQQNGNFHITGCTSSGLDVVIADVERFALWSSAAANTHSFNVKLGANTVAIAPGSAAFVYSNGSGGVESVLRGTAAAIGLTNLSDGPGALGTAGQYLRMNSGATAGEWASRKKPITIGFETALSNTEVFARYVAEEAFTLPSSLTGSVGNCGSPDGSNATVITLHKNGGASFGSITIATGGTVSFSAASATSFAIGDVLTATGPGTATTAAQFAATLLGTI